MRITTDDVTAREWSARVTAIDSLVDETTRNVQVQATLANPGGRLRPGMFVQAEVAARLAARRSSHCQPRPSATRRTAIRSSSSTEMKGEDGKPYRGVRQQFVKPGPAEATRSRCCPASIPATRS